MAYDAGARHRRMREDHAKQRNADYQRNYGPQSHGGGTRSSTFDLDGTIDALIIISSASVATMLSVSVWNGLTGAFQPTQPILVNILKYGGWAVGLGAISVTLHFGKALIRYLRLPFKIAGVLVALVLTSAFIYGLYQGFSGAS